MNNSQNIENYIILKKNEISSSFLKSQKKWFSKPVLYDKIVYHVYSKLNYTSRRRSNREH